MKISQNFVAFSEYMNFTYSGPNVIYQTIPFMFPDANQICRVTFNCEISFFFFNLNKINFYRFLRFFPGGRVVMVTTAEQPSVAVKLLNSRYRYFSFFYQLPPSWFSGTGSPPLTLFFETLTKPWKQKTMLLEECFRPQNQTASISKVHFFSKYSTLIHW